MRHPIGWARLAHWHRLQPWARTGQKQSAQRLTRKNGIEEYPLIRLIGYCLYLIDRRCDVYLRRRPSWGKGAELAKTYINPFFTSFDFIKLLASRRLLLFLLFSPPHRVKGKCKCATIRVGSHIPTLRTRNSAYWLLHYFLSARTWKIDRW